MTIKMKRIENFRLLSSIKLLRDRSRSPMDIETESVDLASTSSTVSVQCHASVPENSQLEINTEPVGLTSRASTATVKTILSDNSLSSVGSLYQPPVPKGKSAPKVTEVFSQKT